MFLRRDIHFGTGLFEPKGEPRWTPHRLIRTWVARLFFGVGTCDIVLVVDFTGKPTGRLNF